MYKVLIADQNRHSGCHTMPDWERHGFVLEAVVDDFAQAASYLKQHPVSLVLIGMKGFPSAGMLLCRQIRQFSRVPIILLGGSGDFRLARKALTYHVSDYLPDPVRAAELAGSLKAVKQELDARQSAAPAASRYPERMAAAETRSSDAVIDVVKRYVEQQLHEQVTLKKISSLLHFNSAYLGQKFKSHENMTFNEYLLQQRMERAKQLLAQTDLRIYEIANEVGYTEIDWFYKKFKEYTGASANEYRKQAFHSA